MKCHVCEEEMTPVISERPFTLGRSTTIILSGLPVFECCACGAHVLHETVMERVHHMIEALHCPSHCQVVPYEPRRT